MRVHTKRKDEMGKRFAIVIGVAAAGVMALGAQTVLAGQPVDTTPPDLQLSGKKKQNPQEDKICDQHFCDVVVTVSCGDEECTARANGKLTNVKNDKLKPDGPEVVPPGEARKMGPELSDRQREHVRKVLDEGEKVRAKVTIRAKDAAGNVATAKRTIKLVK
jgi:hypothetical protein